MAGCFSLGVSEKMGFEAENCHYFALYVLLKKIFSSPLSCLQCVDLLAESGRTPLVFPLQTLFDLCLITAPLSDDL